ncbi:MAG: YCF48-related protein [Xanthomonadales bacterium]|nr:YCF48-related protein [Xanthomonadales bacterium]MDH4020081.1 YCF48-related protein [Xanthomonadales bacterium]
MRRSKRLFRIVCALLFTGWLTQIVVADDHIDVVYAEQMPLATESMLLDIIRSGNTFVAVGERGHVVTSTDGKTWVQAEHVPTRSTLTTIFSEGDRIWAGGHDAVIITSADAGKTWTQLYFDPERNQAIMDIHFSDDSNGVAIGSYGLYLYTSDGGRTWEEKIIDEESDYHLNNLLSFGDNRWLIAGEAGFSYRSYNSGETWEPLEMPYQGSMWGAIKSSEECVLFYGLRGHVMESCDFGTSWRELDTGSESSISGAAEYDGLVLLAANSGTVLTRDDSDDFSVYYHSSGVDFAAALSLGNGNFLLVGEDGVHSYPEIGE